MYATHHSHTDSRGSYTQASVTPAALALPRSAVRRVAMAKRIFLAALCALPLALSAAQTSEYRLSPGDVVKITVYGHADLTANARIGETGKIGFPLIGEIAIANLTTQKASQYIALALSSGGFVRQPRVTVNIESVHSPLVSILGEVHKPGKYPTRQLAGDDVKTISDLLALAGGPKENAADYLTVIQHSAGAKPVHQRVDLIALLHRGDVTQDLPIKDGDIVFVPRMDTFYIYGEVRKPGGYRLERGMTLMQALAVGGGLTPRGTQRGIEIRRRNGKGDLEAIKPPLEATLRPDDVVYVKESWF
jgi:polysaccharide export outer membrane protein